MTSQARTIDKPRSEAASGSTKEMRELRNRLRDLYDDYAAALDAGELERWPDFFTQDCIYKAISRENYDLGLPVGVIDCDGIGMVKDRVMALRSSTVYEERSLRHLISGVRISDVRENGVICAEANFGVFEALPYREPTLFAIGRYVDEIVQSGETLLFRQHLAVFDNYQIRTSLVVPL